MCDIHIRGCTVCQFCVKVTSARASSIGKHYSNYFSKDVYNREPFANDIIYRVTPKICCPLYSFMKKFAILFLVYSLFFCARKLVCMGIGKCNIRMNCISSTKQTHVTYTIRRQVKAWSSQASLARDRFSPIISFPTVRLCVYQPRRFEE